MAIRLDTRAADFAEKFRAFLDTKREVSADVEAAVRAIVTDVATRGDIALSANTRRSSINSHSMPRRLRVTQEEIAAAAAACDRKATDALSFARDRIEAFHRRQMPQDDRFTDALGVELGARWTAIEAVGLYVPGGTAAYPSSVLMNAVPAKVAGVPRLVMVVPAPGGVLPPLVLAAARIAGVDEIYPRRRGAGGCGARLRHRDHRAGRQDRRPRQCLCRRRQAHRVRQGRHRHDRRPLRSPDPRRPDRQSPTGSPPIFWRKPNTTRARKRSLSPTTRNWPARSNARSRANSKRLARSKVAGASWRDFGAVFLVSSLDEALPLVDAVAPEHLEIAAADADASPRASATPGRSLSARTRRKRSATMSPVQITYCRRRVRRASPPGSGCSIS